MADKIKSRIYNLLKYIAVIALVSFMLFYYALSSVSVDCKQDDSFVVPQGAGLNKVVSILEDTGCFNKARMFKWLMFISREDRNIRPGRYTFTDVKNLSDLKRLITTESKDYTRVTILEGWTMNETAGKLSQVIKIDSSIFRCNNNKKTCN